MQISFLLQISDYHHLKLTMFWTTGPRTLNFIVTSLLHHHEKHRMTFEKGGGRVVRRCCVSFQCRGVPLIWIIIGQGPIALAVGSGGGCSDIFSLICHFSSLPPFGGRPDMD